MSISYFTYISGIASFLGFVLQLCNVFPKHAKYRKSILLFVLGMFIGTLGSAFDASHLVYEVPITSITLFISFLALSSLGFLIAGAITEDGPKRRELFTIGGVGIGIMLFCWMLSPLANMEPPYYSKLTINELTLLADSAEARRDYERAIIHLESLKNRFPAEDPRAKAISERILAAKTLQVK